MSTIATLDLATGRIDAMVENLSEGLSVRLDDREPNVGELCLVVDIAVDLPQALTMLLAGEVRPERCTSHHGVGVGSYRAIALTATDANAPPCEPTVIRTWVAPGACHTFAMPASSVTQHLAVTQPTMITLHMAVDNDDSAWTAWLRSADDKPAP